MTNEKLASAIAQHAYRIPDGSDMPPIFFQLRDAITAALDEVVAAERERCAAIATKVQLHSVKTNCTDPERSFDIGVHEAKRYIADIIRADVLETQSK